MKRKSDDDPLLSSPLNSKKAKLILKEHFTSSTHLDFLITEISSSSSKLSVQQIPSLIFGHSQLGEILFETKFGVDVKLRVLKLLKSCFESSTIVEKNGEKVDQTVDNSTTMQDSQIPLLLGAYSAKLSECDQTIYEILRMYERSGGGNVDFSKYYPLIWGERGLEKYAGLKTLGPALWNRPSADEVLQCLDPKLMRWSSSRLPLEITMDTQLADRSFSTYYDPRFLLPLFASLLSSDSLIDLRQFCVDRSCLGYTIGCLSLHDNTLRGVAYTILSRLREHLKSPINGVNSSKTFREKPQIVYLLNLLKQSITKPLARLPSTSTLFVARSVQLMSMPWDSVYPTVQAYLLLKPRLDFGDVPEFYKLFQSSSATDRFWILKLLADAMREIVDYRLCERRDAFRLLFAYYDWASTSGGEAESASKFQVIRIVQAVCRLPVVAPDFCYRYNVLGWLTGAIVSMVDVEKEAEPLGFIAKLIYENVVEKEGGGVPEYVAASWYAAVGMLKSKVSDWGYRQGQSQATQKGVWVGLGKGLTKVGERLGVK